MVGISSEGMDLAYWFEPDAKLVQTVKATFLESVELGGQDLLSGIQLYSTTYTSLTEKLFRTFTCSGSVVNA